MPHSLSLAPTMSPPESLACLSAKVIASKPSLFVLEKYESFWYRLPHHLVELVLSHCNPINLLIVEAAHRHITKLRHANDQLKITSTLPFIIHWREEVRKRFQEFAVLGRVRINAGNGNQVTTTQTQDEQDTDSSQNIELAWVRSEIARKYLLKPLFDYFRDQFLKEVIEMHWDTTAEPQSPEENVVNVEDTFETSSIDEFKLLDLVTRTLSGYSLPTSIDMELLPMSLLDLIVSQVQHLQEVHLCSTSEVRGFSKIAHLCPNIEHVVFWGMDIYDNGYHGTPHTSKIVAEFLKKAAPRLRRLTFTNCHEVSFIVAAPLDLLSTLTISHCTHVRKPCVSSLLSHSPHLKRLELIENYRYRGHARGAADYVLFNAPAAEARSTRVFFGFLATSSFREFKFVDHGLITRNPLAYVCDKVAENGLGLEVFEASYSELSVNGAEALSQFIKTATSLKKLCVHQAFLISPASEAVILRAIYESPSQIKTLSLRGFGFIDVEQLPFEAVTLENVVKSRMDKGLKSLEISFPRSNEGENAARGLAEALESEEIEPDAQLHTLKLVGRLTEESAAAFRRLLHTAVFELDLTGAIVGSEGNNHHAIEGFDEM